MKPLKLYCCLLQITDFKHIISHRFIYSNRIKLFASILFFRTEKQEEEAAFFFFLKPCIANSAIIISNRPKPKLGEKLNPKTHVVLNYHSYIQRLHKKKKKQSLKLQQSKELYKSFFFSLFRVLIISRSVMYLDSIIIYCSFHILIIRNILLRKIM